MLRVFTKASDQAEKRRLMKFVLGRQRPSTESGDSALSSAGDTERSLQDSVLVVSEPVPGSSTGATTYSPAYVDMCSAFHPQDFLDKWRQAAAQSVPASA